MAKQKPVTLTKFELEIMRVLWDLQRASVREIQEKLSDKRRPAYTTVQTIIHRLEEKNAVRRLRKIGNALIFEPAITRKAVHGRLITELLQLFGGSARPLMAHLAEMGKLNLEDVRELETLLAEQQKNPLFSSGKESR
jgi:BlaI family transcriptional regulator, penicillinase repressor